MRFLALAAAVLLVSFAQAADLPKKAPALVGATPTCTVTGCTGWHFGFDVVDSGSGVNVLDLGSVNANGTFLGLDAGWQYFDGSYWAGADVMVTYDLAGPGNVGGFGNIFAFEGVELGGNLFSAFGLAPPATSGFFSTLTSGIPTVQVGACQHGSATGYCAGAALHYFLSNSLEAKLFYLNAQYGTTQLSPLSTVNNENLVGFGMSYHLP